MPINAHGCPSTWKLVTTDSDGHRILSDWPAGYVDLSKHEPSNFSQENNITTQNVLWLKQFQTQKKLWK